LWRFFARPSGALETGAIDPFGNLIRFCEPIANPH
jgi:hypothetical protein